jgi:hypothetical protein
VTDSDKPSSLLRVGVNYECFTAGSLVKKVLYDWPPQFMSLPSNSFHRDWSLRFNLLEDQIKVISFTLFFRGKISIQKSPIYFLPDYPFFISIYFNYFIHFLMIKNQAILC